MIILILLIFVIIGALLFLAPDELRKGVKDHINAQLESEKKKKPAAGVNIS